MFVYGDQDPVPDFALENLDVLLLAFCGLATSAVVRADVCEFGSVKSRIFV